MARVYYSGFAVGLWLIAAAPLPAFAQQQQGFTVEIERRHLGSGEPEQAGFENATLVSNDVYHAPQYMPGHPTAHVLWARVIDVPCTQVAPGKLQCQGYPWSPGAGRAEYLYFRPVFTVAMPRSEAPGEPAPASADTVSSSTPLSDAR